MLRFFRKYQRLFFIFMSVIIITSFSFFGTYGTLNSPTPHAEMAFKAVNGKSISKYDLELMAGFLISDATDKINYGGVWGPNFLNDGVISKDFLDSGLAEVIFEHGKEQFSEDLLTRQAKERSFRPYEHPQSKFLSAKNTWNYFSPDIPKLMERLSQEKDPTTNDAFEIRVSLYLAEKQFPALALKRMLKHQAEQYQWIPEDKQLDQADLTLYNYHHLDDWFGPHFTRAVCQVIINSSLIAEERGYSVSRNEALADLLQNATKSYRYLQKSGLQIANTPTDYFDEQLRRMGIDRNKAINIWRQVLLFRRLFHDYGNILITDALSDKVIQEHSSEYVGGDLYHLPDHLKFAKFKDLQRFETYLDATTKRSDSAYAIPTKFLAATEVIPELVQRRYLVDIKEVDKNQLATKVGLKETWSWQTEEKNWKELEKQFPELAVKGARNANERFRILDGLDDTTRAKIDHLSRQAIIDQHPEWIQKALSSAEGKKKVLSIRKKGGTLPILGVSDPKQLIDELNRKSDKLNQFSADGIHYYQIKVLENGNRDEVLSFLEARQDGTIDQILDQKLGVDKDKADVVAKEKFADILKEIRAKHPEEKSMTEDYAASKRFEGYMKEAYGKIVAGDDTFILVTEESAAGALPKTKSLADQWKLMKTPYRIQRNQESKPAVSVKEAFALNMDGWSKVKAPVNGDVSFFQLKEKGTAIDDDKIAARVRETHRQLSFEAQQELLNQLIDKLL